VAREPAAALSLGTRAATGTVRLIALIGIVGLAVIAGAIMSSQHVQGWIEGLAIGSGAVILTLIVLLAGRHAARRR
jgi:ABC-type uncharacterized transport system permease subunit